MKKREKEINESHLKIKRIIDDDNDFQLCSASTEQKNIL